MWIRKIRKKIARFFKGVRKTEPGAPAAKARKATAAAKKAAERPTRKRPKRIIGRRDNNILLETRKSLKGQINIVHGTGNTVRFGEGSHFIGKLRIRGSNNLIEFGPNAGIRGRIAVVGDNQRVIFGAHSTSVEIYIVCAEGQDVIIGKSCMLSRKIEIRTTDSHSVVDPQTGQRMNKPRSVIIGDHVWIGVGTFVSKGAVIPSNSIVAAMSFVNGRFEEEGVIIAGEPAKVVKQGITWQREPRDQFTMEELDRWKTE
ncbi:MAG: hypothetical protein V4584_14465 [Verrucomicrobiota bacterium]